MPTESKRGLDRLTTPSFKQTKEQIKKFYAGNFPPESKIYCAEECERRRKEKKKKTT